MRVSVDFAGRCLQYGCPGAFGDAQYVDRSQNRGLDGLYGVVLIMYGRGRTCQIVYFIDFDKVGHGDVVPHEFEIRVFQQWNDIVFVAGEKVVETKYFMPLVEQTFTKLFDMNFVRINCQQHFYDCLKGVSDPEQKRKIIGTEFVRVFEDESKRLPNVKFLAQGTIYPDVIESGGNKAATIKSHHNVAGLPKDMKFEGVVEPLRGLFKDEVRALGRQLGLPRRFVERQPFPGPGLAVRVMGEITPEKLEILRNADAIFREEIAKRRIKADQYFAVLTDTRSVGVVGDFRTYNYVIALRAVKTSDFMTCEYAPISHKVLGTVSSRIVNEVKGAGRVVYDITGKPPATIEWC